VSEVIGRFPHYLYGSSFLLCCNARAAYVSSKLHHFIIARQLINIADELLSRNNVLWNVGFAYCVPRTHKDG
jgi:hypothetical protein